MVCGNARAARSLRIAHSEQQRQQGLEAWTTPRIFDWDGWLSTLWREHLLMSPTAPLLLSGLQERATWERILREHGEGALVVSAAGMAELAQQAYHLLSRYRCQGERERSWEYAGLGDAEAFRRWSVVFDQECRKHRWMSRSGLENLIAASLRAQTIKTAQEILLVGFDRLTPMQNALLETLQALGAGVSSLDQRAGEHAGTRRLVEAADLRDEIATCAWWARRQLEQNSDARIGVIVPDVNAVRGEVSRAFRRVLLPEALGLEPAPLPFEFSLGMALETAPVVKAALLFLRWLDAPLAEEEVTWLALSGFFGQRGETRETGLSRLAQFDAEMRRLGGWQPEIPMESWLRRTPRNAGEEAWQLRNRWKAAREAGMANGVGHRSRTFAEWAQVAHGTLSRAGWASAAKPDSVEFQAIRRWERLLDDVAALAFDDRRAEYRDFVAVLSTEAGKTIFSPQSQGAPVQIMGVLESAGQSFHAVWFLGADDTQWPAPGRPHPLIPIAIQRAAEMPHATPETDWRLTQTITHRVASSAGDCVFSYARQNQEGLVRPSPLLAEIFGENSIATPAEILRSELQVAPVPRRVPRTSEEIDTSSVTWPAELIAGGANVLKSQAACPFQAFATRRLRAKELDRAEWGLTAAEKGKLLHSVLEQVWSETTDRDWRLMTRDDLVTATRTDRLASILEHHVEQALNGWRDPENAWMQAYLEAEKRRMLELLTQWFEVEARRPAFEVKACEQTLPDVEVGALRLKLRVDRVDQLRNGGLLLLDYKTGEVATSAWKGARPGEPQLPLYAAYGNVGDLRGVLFAQIRAGKAGFVGHVNDAVGMLDASLTKSSALMKYPFEVGMMKEWAAALRELAEEFLRGEAAVMPRLYPKTCEFCPLPALCRVRETGIPLQAAAINGESLHEKGDETNSGSEPDL